MKRFFSLTLALVLCLFVASAAFADGFTHTETYTVFMPEGHVTTETEWGHYQTTTVTYEDYTACTVCHNNPCTCAPKPVCQTCHQNPCCCAPQPICPTCHHDPCKCKPIDYAKVRRESAHANMKSYGKSTLDLLRRELKRIGWDYKCAKLVRSYETRLIYGSRGDNKHPEQLKPIVFYCIDNPGLKFECYMIVNPVQSTDFYTCNGYRDYRVFFATDFNIGSGPYTYNDEWIITCQKQDGPAAVAEFIKFLEFYTECDGDIAAE